MYPTTGVATTPPSVVLPVMGRAEQSDTFIRLVASSFSAMSVVGVAPVATTTPTAQAVMGQGGYDSVYIPNERERMKSTVTAYRELGGLASPQDDSLPNI